LKDQFLISQNRSNAPLAVADHVHYRTVFCSRDEILELLIWHRPVVYVRPETDYDDHQAKYVGQGVGDEEAVGLVRVAVYQRGYVDRDYLAMPRVELC
jgi:hypothetical protein